MIILDTDHINILQNQHGNEFQNLTGKMSASADQDFVTTVITFEEQMRGWLALINRSNDAHRQVAGYDKLNTVVDFFARWNRLPFDDASATEFKSLRDQKIRIGTMDLKIASIALSQDALVLSANLRDFEQIPNLQVEDWLH